MYIYVRLRSHEGGGWWIVGSSLKFKSPVNEEELEIDVKGQRDID